MIEFTPLQSAFLDLWIPGTAYWVLKSRFPRPLLGVEMICISFVIFVWACELIFDRGAVSPFIILALAVLFSAWSGRKHSKMTFTDALNLSIGYTMIILCSTASIIALLKGYEEWFRS